MLQGVINGTSINLATLSTRSLSISISSTTAIGSVRIQYDGQVRTENIAPYSVAGDTNGAFTPLNLTVGFHNLIATPYPGADLSGTPGPSLNITFRVVDSSTTLMPTLLTQQDSDHAIAFNAATFVREPFQVFTEQNFSSDKRTRIMLFVTDLDFAPEDSPSDLQVLAENASIGTVLLPVEHMRKVPFFDWLTQVQVILPDNLAHAGDVLIRVNWRGHSSNQGRVSIKPQGVARLMSFPDWLGDSTLAVNLRLWPHLATRRRLDS